MKPCPYCGYSNYDTAIECRHCQASFIQQDGTLYKTPTSWVGPQRAREIRNKALSFIVLALLIKVYWGGYGPWPIVDAPLLVSLRSWLEPLFLYGCITGYLAGWVLNWI